MKRYLDSGDDPVPQRAAAIFTSMAIYIAVLLLVLVVVSVLR